MIAALVAAGRPGITAHPQGDHESPTRPPRHSLRRVRRSQRSKSDDEAGSGRRPDRGPPGDVAAAAAGEFGLPPESERAREDSRRGRRCSSTSRPASSPTPHSGRGAAARVCSATRNLPQIMGSIPMVRVPRSASRRRALTSLEHGLFLPTTFRLHRRGFISEISGCWATRRPSSGTGEQAADRGTGTLAPVVHDGDDSASIAEAGRRRRDRGPPRSGMGPAPAPARVRGHRRRRP
jgi:hypothetical protein